MNGTHRENREVRDRWTELSFSAYSCTHRVYFGMTQSINYVKLVWMAGATSYFVSKPIVNVYRDAGIYSFHMLAKKLSHSLKSPNWNLIYEIIKYVIIFVLQSCPEANDIRIRAHHSCGVRWYGFLSHLLDKRAHTAYAFARALQSCHSFARFLSTNTKPTDRKSVVWCRWYWRSSITHGNKGNKWMCLLS